MLLIFFYFSYYFLFVKSLNRVGNSNINSIKNVRESASNFIHSISTYHAYQIIWKDCNREKEKRSEPVRALFDRPMVHAGASACLPNTCRGKRANACRFLDSMWWAGFYGFSWCSWVLFNALLAVQVIFRRFALFSLVFQDHTRQEWHSFSFPNSRSRVIRRRFCIMCGIFWFFLLFISSW